MCSPDAFSLDTAALCLRRAFALPLIESRHDIVIVGGRARTAIYTALKAAKHAHCRRTRFSAICIQSQAYATAVGGLGETRVIRERRQ
ncbi:hypothetical protein VTO73DRAFT_5954 [Trametes versicolor]